MSKGAQSVDALTRAIISNAIVNIANEGVDVLDKTAISPILSEAKDRCLAIADAKGRLLGMCESGLPLHVAGCEVAFEKAITKFGDSFEPGDVVLQNDPYHGGGNHLPDWIFMVPIFVDGEFTFITMVRGHQQDTKGHLPGGYATGAFDIQSEGLLIPPTKVQRKGEYQETYDLILHNVRWPEIVRIDNLAMIGGLRKVEQKMGELCAKYTKETVLEAMDIVIRDSEAAVRAEIAQWPDGTYEGESLCDRDGSGNESPTVRVAVTIEGDSLTIDLTKSDDQVSFVNSPIATTYAMVFMGLIPRFNPDIPLNSGKLAPVKLVTRKGTVVDPEYPATVGACAVFVGGTIVEAIQVALGQAIPEKVDAQWSPAMQWICFGQDPRTGEPYWGINFQQDGGTGATANVDGIHGAGIACGGGLIQSFPTELAELAFPWLTVKWELIEDSAGVGKFRGGLGTTWEAIHYADHSEFETGGCSGEKHRPEGIDGGGPGIYADMWAVRDGERHSIPTFGLFECQKDDLVGTIASGGGGHGNAFERDVEMVRDDVRNGYVSVDAARNDYGVAIDPANFEVDVAATEKLRQQA